MRNFFFFLWILGFFLTMTYTQENRKFANNEPLIEAQVDSLLKEMTLDEKIGQMTLHTADYDTKPFLREEYVQRLKEGRIGAIFNAIGADFTRQIQKIAMKETRMKIPILFGYDVIHGFKTIFPIPLGEAATWDMEAISMSARVSAREASAAGIHWTFAPMVDIARDPRWGRIAEGSGEDPYLGSLIASARVRGFQGQDLASDDTVLACAKHFAGYGAAEAGRDYNTVDMSERVLREVYLPPFQSAVDSGAATMMTSFNEISGVPSTCSKMLLTNILRGEWQFKGFVVTDYTSINELLKHGIAADESEAARLSALAGVDMDMEGGVFYHELKRLVERKVVPEKYIDDAVRRILTLKFKLGLFDDPYAYCNPEREKQRTMTKEHLDIALDVAKKSLVLLKNSKNLLPLAKNGQTIFLVGPLADNQSELIGSWCGAGDYKQAITLRQGIQNKISSETTLLYAKGCEVDAMVTTQEEQEKMAEMAKKADVIVVALGERAWMSGEAASRSSIELPGMQEQMLKELYKTGKPIVLILMNGRPLSIPWADAHIPAILECWFPGTQAGNAIAEVLFGDYNPSAKLPVSFPRSLGQVPIYYNYKNTGRPIDPANKYTSKYLDIENTPLYPFGFGLSYTTFSYSDLTLEKAKIGKTENLNVSVHVKNTGGREGTETVQLYIRDEVGSVTRPVKELKRFQKVTLKPGETRKVEFSIMPKDLCFYNLDMIFTLEPGFFQVMVGTNSADALNARFEVAE